jgi:propionate CoA-transferase
MKIVTADQAIAMIKNSSNVTVSGFGHCGSPELLMEALERRFIEKRTPCDLSFLVASAPGDRGTNGFNRFAHDGLIKRIIGGFWALAPKIGQMVTENRIEAHNWPQGVVSHMFRAIASGRPGVISDVGIGTFIDPDQEGGRLNAKTAETLVEKVQVNGRESLMYRAIPLHAALLRGTRADTNGNITLEREANLQDILAQAQAVRNSGGIVIVQVLDIATAGSIPSHLIQIPGIFVDYVVVAESDFHRQTYGEHYNPAYSGEWPRGLSSSRPGNDEPKNARRIIGRRALLELINTVSAKHRSTPAVVNLGIGTPEEIARQLALNPRNALDHEFMLTVESGAIGGTPAGGMSFGATSHPQAVIKQGELFDFYDGGGIDIAFLGFGQIDKSGRVNVASLGNKLNGVGGFINISQAAKRLVFCGSFTASGLQVVSDDAQHISIAKEGRALKLVERVERVCYDPAGRAGCRSPLVITERAVMRLSSHGLEVIEIAPGVDLRRDVLERSGFPLTVSSHLKTMPLSVFSSGEVSSPFVT